MKPAAAAIARRPLTAFFPLALLITWPLTLLHSVSLAFPLLGLFGPAAAALLVAGVGEGRAGILALRRGLTLWRVGLQWYAVALGLPAALALASMALNSLVGEPTEFGIGEFSPIGFLLAALIVGEELGWRGFALPRLLASQSALGASLVLGTAWAVWHIPNFLLAGFPHHGKPFLPFLLTVISYSILFTWLANHTRGSVLIATLFHAAINLFSPTGVAPEQQDRLELAVYGTAALLVILVRSSGLRGPRTGDGRSSTPMG